MLLDDNLALVYSNFSKTNQFMNRQAIIPLCKHETLALDPIFHLKQLLSSEISPVYPAFSYFENGIKCITYASFTKKLKELLDLAGYSPSLYSGHSMRRGGATLLFNLAVIPWLYRR